MENATDALKIAFAIFVFVLAITTTYMLVSLAKSTADNVLYRADKTNYYDPIKSNEKNRIVSCEEVISALYRCYEESLSVTVVLDSSSHTFDPSINHWGSYEKANESIAKFILADDGLAWNESDDKSFRNRKFTEQFVEIPISGITKTSQDDGSQIIIASGAKKIYVTYTAENN